MHLNELYGFAYHIDIIVGRIPCYSKRSVCMFVYVFYQWLVSNSNTKIVTIVYSA